MPRLAKPQPSRDRRTVVFRAIDDSGQITWASNVASLYRRILIRNELLRNIAAMQGTSSTRR